MKQKKSLYPFRLGCTSYVFPDEIIPNVRRMSPHVDDIELVLFESPDLSNLPSEADIEILASLAQQNNLTYTVHLPIDHKAGAISVEERMAFVKAAKQVIRLTAPLNPHAYILHFEGIRFDCPTEQVLFWRNAINEVCMHLNAGIAIDPSLICVENLAYPSEWHLELVHRFGYSFCFDIGHLWINKVENWLDIVGSYLPHTRVIHLHGIDHGKDHKSLTCGPKDHIIQLVDKILPLFEGVVTLEVFNEKDTFESLRLVHDLWER